MKPIMIIEAVLRLSKDNKPFPKWLRAELARAFQEATSDHNGSFILGSSFKRLKSAD